MPTWPGQDDNGGSSGVLALPDQSEWRERESQIDLLLGPQAGWPVDSSQDLGTKKEHRAKVGLWEGPVYQALSCWTRQASYPASQGLSASLTSPFTLLHKSEMPTLQTLGFAAAFDSSKAEFLVCEKAWESNSSALGYVIVVRDDVWWPASDRNVFYFHLQVSKFLSSICLGAKDRAGQAASIY